MPILMIGISLSGFYSCTLSPTVTTESLPSEASGSDHNPEITKEHTGLESRTPEAEPTTIPEAEPSGKAEVTATPKAVPNPEAEASSQPKPAVRPETKPNRKPTVTPVPEPTATPVPETTVAPLPKPTAAAPIPSGASETQTELTPPGKEDSLTAEEYAKQVIKQIIKVDMEDVEKVRVVHDYIILNTAYDAENLEAGTIPKESFTAEGVLFQGKAVCQGYAETFELFMKLLGIDCKFVEGKDLKTGVSHAWNMVLLDGDWYQIDVTWDDPLPDQKGKAQYKYFLVTDKVMAADHSWNTKKYPACDSVEYRYYIYKDYIIGSIEEYEDKFIELYNSGERTITILYPEEGMPDMNFLKKYDFLFQTVDGKRKISYRYYQTWRMGDYTVYTVMID